MFRLISTKTATQRAWLMLLLLALIPNTVLRAQVKNNKPYETIIVGDKPAKTCGKLPALGKLAPAFTATNKDMQDVKLSDYKGKWVVINVFPSVDTPTCAMSVRRFNEMAAQQNNTVVLCVSMDLPFAQKRFCAAEGLDNVVTLSLFRNDSFAKAYGLRLIEGRMAGLMARTVLIVDPQGKLIYANMVEKLSDEPDYDGALNNLKQAQNKAQKK